jgi:hypothetical protein
MVQLLVLFTLAFVIHIPVLNIYQEFNFFDQEGTDPYQAALGLSMGNIGFSESKCFF